jgi:hypothetical protein
VVKLFLKKPSNNQGLVQKVLQLATADSDNPDIRDRAYIYWRLLSGDLDVAKVRTSPPISACRLLTSSQNIILAQKPAITTTVTSLPPVLLEQLLAELSTLASVYHKPPESFVGKGRFGAEAIQRAAIQEQRQNAAENPIAASVAAAAAANGTGGGAAPQSNIENLLDIDFDGAAPASAEQNPGTPDRVASPVSPEAAAPSGGMADIMGLFDAPTPALQAQIGAAPAAGGMNDLMSGFAGMDLSGTSAPPPPGQQLGHGNGKAEQTKGSDDLLGLF